MGMLSLLITMETKATSKLQEQKIHIKNIHIYIINVQHF